LNNATVNIGEHRKLSLAMGLAIQELLGFGGLTKTLDQLLRGTMFENYDQACFPGVRAFVEAMIIPKEMRNLSKMNTVITKEDFIRGISA